MGSACYPTYDAEEYAVSQKNSKFKSSSSWDQPVSYEMERESISSKPVCVWSEDLFSGTIDEKSELPVGEQNSKLPKIDSSEVEAKVCESRRNSRNTDALLEAMMWNRSSDAAYNLQLTSPSTVSSYKAFPMTKVLPHLYIGTYDDANNEEDLRTKGITHILSLIGRKSSVT